MVSRWRGWEHGGKGRTNFEHAIGSSHDPGTVWMTMFDSFTPDARSLSFVPLRRGSMIAMEG